MKKNLIATERHYQAMADFADRQRPISNTVKRELVKLGWVSVRQIQVFGGPHVQRKIRTWRLTSEGHAALAAWRSGQ